MKALIFADIHSNLEAFQSVLADAQEQGGFDEIWCLGDLVGYGADPGPCIDLLRQYEHFCIAGNHDWAAAGKLSLDEFNPLAARANLWTASQLSDEHKEYLANLPLRLEMQDFTLVHGSPVDPIWEYILSPSTAWTSFQHFRTKFCLVGHSHIPFMCALTEDRCIYVDFPIGTPVQLGELRLIVNPGSVGQPRDGDPRASYVIYDSAQNTLLRLRAEYAVKTTMVKILKAGLPPFLAERLSYGK